MLEQSQVHQLLKETSVLEQIGLDDAVLGLDDAVLGRDVGLLGRDVGVLGQDVGVLGQDVGVLGLTSGLRLVVMEQNPEMYKIIG